MIAKRFLAAHGPALGTALAYVALCLYAGRVWRAPTDDEIYTFLAIDVASVWEVLLRFGEGSDVHPAGSYVVYYLLKALGADFAGLHLGACLFSATAVFFAAKLLERLTEGDGLQPFSAGERALALLLLAASPMMLSQGDAVRWYPLFTMLTVIAVHELVRGRGRTAALLLGLAASVNVIGFANGFLLAAYVAYRRGIRPGVALPVAAIFLAGAALGLWTLLESFLDPQRSYTGSQLRGIGRGVVQMAGGFVGGLSLGMVGTLFLGTVFLALLALVWRRPWRSLLQRQPALEPILLLFALPVAMAMTGFSKPRSFMYCGLLLGVLMAYLARWLGSLDRAAAARFWFLSALTVLPVLPSVNLSERPFMRSAAIPYEEILMFVAERAQNRPVTVMTSDPVLGWLIAQRQPGICVEFRGPQCRVSPGGEALLITGHSSLPALPAQLRRRVHEETRRSKPELTVFYGLDREYRLKASISGLPLTPHLLQAELFSSTGP